MRAKLAGYFLLGLIRILTGSQARWWGCPPKAEQRIYFANHQSHADLVMVWAALPKGEVVPVLCSVTFGVPMQLQPEEDRQAFLQRARSAVIALRDI